MSIIVMNNRILTNEIFISPPLRRTYKSKCCYCGDLSYVYNKKRKGGICYICRRDFRASFIISKWFKRIKRIQKEKEKYEAMLLCKKIKIATSSLVSTNICSFL